MIRRLEAEDYVPIFRDAGIGLVVRLNKKQCPEGSGDQGLGLRAFGFRDSDLGFRVQKDKQPSELFTGTVLHLISAII